MAAPTKSVQPNLLPRLLEGMLYTDSEQQVRVPAELLGDAHREIETLREAIADMYLACKYGDPHEAIGKAIETMSQPYLDVYERISINR